MLVAVLLLKNHQFSDTIGTMYLELAEPLLLYLIQNSKTPFALLELLNKYEGKYREVFDVKKVDIDIIIDKSEMMKKHVENF